MRDYKSAGMKAAFEASRWDVMRVAVLVEKAAEMRVVKWDILSAV